MSIICNFYYSLSLFLLTMSFILEASDHNSELKKDIRDIVVQSLMHQPSASLKILLKDIKKSEERKNLYADALFLIAAHNPDSLKHAIEKVTVSEDNALDRLPIFFLKKFETSSHLKELCENKDRLAFLVGEFMRYRLAQFRDAMPQSLESNFVTDTDHLFLNVLCRNKLLNLHDLWSALDEASASRELVASSRLRSVIFCNIARDLPQDAQFFLKSHHTQLPSLLQDNFFLKQCAKNQALFNLCIGGAINFLNPFIPILNNPFEGTLPLLEAMLNSADCKIEALIEPCMPEGISVLQKIVEEYPVLLEKILVFFKSRTYGTTLSCEIDRQFINLFNRVVARKSVSNVFTQAIIDIFMTRDRYQCKDLLNRMTVTSVDFLITAISNDSYDDVTRLCLSELFSFYDDLDHLSIDRQALFALLDDSKKKIVRSMTCAHGDYIKKIQILIDGMSKPFFKNYFIYQDVYIHSLIRLGCCFFQSHDLMLSSAEELADYLQKISILMESIPHDCKRYHYLVAEGLLVALSSDIQTIIHGSASHPYRLLTELVRLHELCGESTCQDIIALKKMIIKQVRRCADDLPTVDFQILVYNALAANHKSVISCISLFKEVFESDKAVLFFFSQMLHVELQESALTSLSWAAEDLEKRSAIIQTLSQVVPELVVNVVQNRVDLYVTYGLKSSLDLFSYLELIDPSIIRSYSLKISAKEREALWFKILSESTFNTAFGDRLEALLHRMYGSVEKGYSILTAIFGLTIKDSLFISLDQKRFSVRQKIKTFILKNKPDVLIKVLQQQLYNYVSVTDMTAEECRSYLDSLDDELRVKALNDARQDQTMFSRIDAEYVALLQALVDAGLSVNVRCEGNRTALIEAVERGDEILFEFLISHGADVMLVDDTDKSVLDHALRILDYDFIMSCLQEVEDAQTGESFYDTFAIDQLRERVSLRRFFIDSVVSIKPELVNRRSTVELILPFARWCLYTTSFFLDEEVLVNNFIEEDMIQIFDILCLKGMDPLMVNAHGLTLADIADELSLVRLRDHICQSMYSHGDYISEQEALSVMQELLNQDISIESIDLCGKQVRACFQGKEYRRKLRSEIIDLAASVASSSVASSDANAVSRIVDASGNGSFMTYESYRSLVAHGMLQQQIKSQFSGEASNILALKHEVVSLATYLKKIVAKRTHVDEQALLLSFDDYPCRDVFSQEGLVIALSDCRELLDCTQGSALKDRVNQALSSAHDLRCALSSIASLLPAEIDRFVNLYIQGFIDLEMIMFLVQA